MLQPAIVEKLETLPESLQTEVLHFIEFLSERYAEKVQKPEDSASPQKKRHGFGIWKGKVWMAEDFDEPIEDMKDYM